MKHPWRRAVRKKCQRTGEFGRAGRDADEARGEVPGELRRRRVAPAIGRMTPHLVGREERPVQVDALDARATCRHGLVPNRPARLDHRVDLVRGAGGRRRKDRGGAVPRMDGAGGADGCRRAVHEVGASPAMHVHVDEARRDEAAARVDDRRTARHPGPGAAHRRDPAVTHDDAGIGQETVGQDGGGVGDDEAVGRHARSVAAPRARRRSLRRPRCERLRPCCVVRPSPSP